VSIANFYFLVLEALGDEPQIHWKGGKNHIENLLKNIVEEKLRSRKLIMVGHVIFSNLMFFS